MQEALTNVVRHAASAHAVVSLDYRPDTLVVTVTDDGGTTPQPPTPGTGCRSVGGNGTGRNHDSSGGTAGATTDGEEAPDRGGVVELPSTGDGHGLIGIRERVALTGGTVTTGPRLPHGFRVRAVLPLVGHPAGDPALRPVLAGDGGTHPAPEVRDTR